MVAAVRRKSPMREVARDGDRRLDRVEWSNRPDGLPRPVNRSTAELEDLVLTTRRELKDTSDLGEFGAAAISLPLVDRGVTPCPRSAPSAGVGPWTADAAFAAPPLPPDGIPGATESSTFEVTSRFRGYNGGLGGTSPSTTASGFTGRWKTGPRRPSPGP